MGNIEIPKTINQNGQEKKIPNYENKFGHMAEMIIRSALGKRGVVIEKVEQGTKFEDCNQKVDFWIKIMKMEDPIGIQYTTNKEEYERKKEFLKTRNFLAKKENRPDSEINWSGNANVLVIKGDPEKMIGYWKKIELEGVKPEDAVSDEFIRNFFSQVLSELSVANPKKREILLDIFFEIAKEAKEKK